MKKVVCASATALMMAALLTGCDNKCGISNTVCEPVQCTPAQTSARVTRVVTAGTPGIAVMPFQCMTDRPESGIIVADAMAESLASFDGCVVYSPGTVTGTVKFKDGDVVDPIEVGKKMNVPYILTGRVTEYNAPSEGGQTSVAVTARLIDAKTGQEVWTARQYEEYMKTKSLDSWSSAASSDLARAINIGGVEVPVIETSAVSQPMAVAAAGTGTELELEADIDCEVPLELALVDPYAGGSAPLPEVRFNSDTSVEDFGLAQIAPPPAATPKVSATVEVDAYGFDTGSPLTARYGEPTLPRDEVGRILDKFEDPNPPRIVTPAKPEKAAKTEPEVAYVPAPAPATPEPETYQPEAGTLTLVQPGSGTADLLQYHYTGANPFADGPGEKSAEEKEAGTAFLPSEITAPETGTASLFDEVVPEVAVARDKYSAEVMYMPEPPNAALMQLPPPVPPESCGQDLAEAPAPAPVMSDTSAMAAPALPSEESGETMFMPEPIQLDPPAIPEPREVKPSDDGTFKVTITAEQFLQGDEFDFFGSLSESLDDMSELEG